MPSRRWAASLFPSSNVPVREFNLGQAMVCRTMRAVLDSLGIENHTIPRHDELGFILDRSIRQTVATQAPITFILSPRCAVFRVSSRASDKHDYARLRRAMARPGTHTPPPN